MYLLIIFLSIIGSCLARLFGRYLGPMGAIFITTSCSIFSFFLSLAIFYEVFFCDYPLLHIKLTDFDWINSEVLDFIDCGFVFDGFTIPMCVIITYISSLVHLYSIEYMSHDSYLPKFMSYLSLFTFFMLILVTADNHFQMFVGWEGVGLTSYLLINFWCTRILANKAVVKAMDIRIWDFLLLIGILLIFICSFVIYVCFISKTCLIPQIVVHLLIP